MTSPARTLRLAAVLAALAVLVGACANPATPSPSSPAPGSSAVTLVVSPSPSPSFVVASASPDASPPMSPLPSDSPSPSVSPSVSASPAVSPAPTATPRPFSGHAVATRVVVAALGIDLPVVKPPSDYPYCNVAMYFGKPMGQPGEHKATYLFAHARDGMFGPIWELTIVKRTPNKMVGMLVDVYTSDSKVHTYRIVKVLPHQWTLNAPAAARTDQLWLQTSEGPNKHYPKTQVVANPVSVAAASYAASHPKAHIVRCV